MADGNTYEVNIGDEFRHLAEKIDQGFGAVHGRITQLAQDIGRKVDHSDHNKLAERVNKTNERIDRVEERERTAEAARDIIEKKEGSWVRRAGWVGGAILGLSQLAYDITVSVRGIH